MANSLNQINILGRCGEAPVWHKGAKERVTFSVATESGFRDPNTGDWTPRTQWFKVLKWKPPAFLRRVPKGARVFVTGEHRSNQWEDDSGIKRTRWEVVASEILVLTPLLPEDGEQASQSQAQAQAPPASQTPANTQAPAPAPAQPVQQTAPPQAQPVQQAVQQQTQPAQQAVQQQAQPVQQPPAISPPAAPAQAEQPAAAQPAQPVQPPSTDA